jgi:hypothetical protein
MPSACTQAWLEQLAGLEVGSIEVIDEDIWPEGGELLSSGCMYPVVPPTDGRLW